MPFSDEFEKLLQSWKQMDVDRKLREELRMDSQRLHEEFREEYRKRRKRPYGESHPYNAFIPKRFEDLKPNGGIRFRRIPIKLTYHKARLKRRKRWLMRENSDPSVTQKPEISTSCLRLGVKSVGMKKQYHQKKRTAQVKLAQACKSWGMFLDSPSFRDPKSCTKICVVKRQIVDTGVKRETYLFRYEFTSLDPKDIDCRVDMWIGDHFLFAEEVTALEHDDLDAAMESLQEVTSMETSKYKNRIKLSHVHQKWGKRGFHKVRFKDILHQGSKMTAEKVTQGGEPFKMGKSESLHRRGSKYTRPGTVRCYKVRKRKRGFDFQFKYSGDDSSLCLSMLFGNCEEVSEDAGGKETKLKHSLNCGEELDPSLEIHDWDPGQAESAKRLLELLKSSHSEKILVNGAEAVTMEQEHDSVSSFSELAFEICVADTGWQRGSGTDNFSFSTCVKKQTWRLVKNFCGRQVSEIFLAVQVWEPGGDSDKQVQYMKKLPEPLWSFVGDSLTEMKVIRGAVAPFLNGESVITFSVFGFLGLEDKAVLLPGRKMIYDQKMIKRQHSYKSTLLLPSVVTYVTSQSPRPPELSLFIVRYRRWRSIKPEVGEVQNATRATSSSNDMTWSQVYEVIYSIISVEVLVASYKGVGEEFVTDFACWVMRKAICDAVVKLLYLCPQRNEESEPVNCPEWDPGGVSLEKVQIVILNISCGLLKMEQGMETSFANSWLELFTRKGVTDVTSEMLCDAKIIATVLLHINNLVNVGRRVGTSCLVAIGLMFHLPRPPELFSDKLECWFWYVMGWLLHFGLNENLMMKKWPGAVIRVEKYSCRLQEFLIDGNCSQKMSGSATNTKSQLNLVDKVVSTGEY